MPVPFTPDHQALASATSNALNDTGRAQITELPQGLAAEPPLEDVWIFRFSEVLELYIASHHRAQKPDGPIAEACAAAEQPGSFRLVATAPATDAGLDQLIGHLGTLVEDRLPAHRPARPEQLTDLTAVLATREGTTIPTATQLAAELGLSVKGQNEAINTMANAVSAHLHKVEPRRPLRVLLVGPSGVGKSETHRSLVDALSDTGSGSRPWQGVVLEGNQLSEPHAVADLLGSPAGYTAHGAGTNLIQALAADPRTIVLFDEWTKAHRDVQTALMGVMDTGFLQLRHPIGGRWQLDCRQAIFLFTSNQGAAQILDEAQPGQLQGLLLEQHARRVLVAQGMPEWIAGRHGYIAVYRPLSVAAIAEIATLHLAQAAVEFGLDLIWVEPEVVAHLLHEADTAATGARALHAVTERLVVPVLAAHCTSGAPDVDRRVVLRGSPVSCVAYSTWSTLTSPDPTSPPHQQPAAE